MSLSIRTYIRNLADTIQEQEELRAVSKRIIGWDELNSAEKKNDAERCHHFHLMGYGKSVLLDILQYIIKKNQLSVVCYVSSRLSKHEFCLAKLGLPYRLPILGAWTRIKTYVEFPYVRIVWVDNIPDDIDCINVPLALQKQDFREIDRFWPTYWQRPHMIQVTDLAEDFERWLRGEIQIVAWSPATHFIFPIKQRQIINTCLKMALRHPSGPKEYSPRYPQSL